MSKNCDKSGEVEEDKQVCKSFSFTTDQIAYEVVETKSGKEFFITGYISTSDKDLENDIITRKGLQSMVSQLEDKDILTDLDHDVWTTENNNLVATGKIIDSKLDDRGVFTKVKLNPSWKRFDDNNQVIMTFKELWSSIKNGFTNAFSVAFMPIKATTKVVNDTTVRLLDDLNLINVALTGVPMNPGARMTGHSMKSAVIKSIATLKDKEEIKMTVEKKSEEPAPVVETEEVKEVPEVKEEAKEPEPAPAPAEPEKAPEPAPAPAEPEQKAITEMAKQLKSMADKINSLEKANTELSEKAVFKSQTPEQPEVKTEEADVSVIGML